MKIDADSNGSVDWPEFMNYMLLENYIVTQGQSRLWYTSLFYFTSTTLWLLKAQKIMTTFF